MRDKWTNEILIEGYVFNIGGSGKLYEGTTGPDSKRPNTDYISGTVNICTDEDGINIVPVRFNFVTEKWKNGKDNSAWKVLKEIINTNNTWENVGKDNAIKVCLQCSVGVNDFLGRDGNMVEAKSIDCSFARFANNGFSDKRNDFKFDMLIAAAALQEVEDGDDYLNLRGYAFDFRKNLIPVTLTVREKGGIDYFESKDISNANPLLTEVRGKIVSTTQKIEHEIESAWGAPQVEYTTRTLRAWDVTGCSPEPMDWDDESTITLAEFKEALQNRETQKAEAKARQEARQNQNSSGFPSSSKDDDLPFGTPGSEAKTTTSADDFKF